MTRPAVTEAERCACTEMAQWTLFLADGRELWAFAKYGLLVLAEDKECGSVLHVERMRGTIGVEMTNDELARRLGRLLDFTNTKWEVGR